MIMLVGAPPTSPSHESPPLDLWKSSITLKGSWEMDLNSVQEMPTPLAG